MLHPAKEVEVVLETSVVIVGVVVEETSAVKVALVAATVVVVGAGTKEELWLHETFQTASGSQSCAVHLTSKQ